MSAGFFDLKPSQSLVYTYTSDEIKVVGGEFILTDETSGEVTDTNERDVPFFAAMTRSSPGNNGSG